MTVAGQLSLVPLLEERVVEPVRVNPVFYPLNFTNRLLGVVDQYIDSFCPLVVEFDQRVLRPCGDEVNVEIYGRVCNRGNLLHSLNPDVLSLDLNESTSGLWRGHRDNFVQFAGRVYELEQPNDYSVMILKAREQRS